MTRTIGLKIFGLALFLLMLMVAVAILSSLRIGQTNDRMETVASYYVPITQAVTRIGIHVLQQSLLLERLYQSHGAPSPHEADIDRLLTLYQQEGQKIDELAAQAVQAAADGVGQAATEKDRIEFARLGVMVQDIEREHQDFHDRGLSIQQAWAQGQHDLAQRLRQDQAKDEDEYEQRVAEVRRQLQQLTQGSVQAVKAQEQQVLHLNWALTTIAIILGLLFAALVTAGLLRPVRRLVGATQEVVRGNLDVEVRVTSRDEIGQLATSFNHMVNELRVKERIKETFGKYVDPRIVEELIQQSDLNQTARRRVVTVLFCDMEKSTALGERMTPGGLVNLLNQYFTLMSEPISVKRGVIDKYIGDAIMAFWGPPFISETEHATLACLAALDQLAKLDDFRRMLPELMGIRKDLPIINMRTGISTGEVVVGNIGSDLFKNYTVLGDTVNVAARLESANKLYGTKVLLSEETYTMARDAIEARPLDLIRVAGKSEPTHVFELLARKGRLDPATAAMRDRFEQGLQAYQARDWGRAHTCFEAALSHKPDDAPSGLFLERVRTLRRSPPADGWDGVWHIPKDLTDHGPSA